jgi:hypothetical protein
LPDTPQGVCIYDSHGLFLLLLLRLRLSAAVDSFSCCVTTGTSYTWLPPCPATQLEKSCQQLHASHTETLFVAHIHVCTYAQLCSMHSPSCCPTHCTLSPDAWGLFNRCSSDADDRCMCSPPSSKKRENPIKTSSDHSCKNPEQRRLAVHTARQSGITRTCLSRPHH